MQAAKMRRDALTNLDTTDGGGCVPRAYRASVSSSRTAWKRLLSILPW